MLLLGMGRTKLVLAMGSACAVILIVLLGAGSAASTGTAATYASLSVPGPSGSETLSVWRNQSNGRLTFGYAGSGSYDVLSGSTLQEVDDGTVSSFDAYDTADDVWQVITTEYGVTQAAVDNALAAGTATSEPAAAAATPADIAVTNPADGTITYLDPYTMNKHYDDHLARLESAIGFGVPKVYALDGYMLMDSAITLQYGPDKDSSGNVASLWYAAPGSVDSAITVNLAKPKPGSGNWGSAYQSTLNTAAPDLAGPGYAATKNGDNQVVFMRQSTYVAVTTTWTPTDAEWATIIASFAG